MGASKETLYRHFGSKDGLIEAVLEARSDLDQPVDPVSGPRVPGTTRPRS